ncbi:MAG: hypothetical protein IPL26_00055 [Leptospiraceae bacterium]|nr:hypothetical protein [Leptospiraceae bacterium]
MITTQKQIQELIDRENKMSPFERLTRYLKKLLIQIFFAIVITFIGVWVLVAFTDFKLPFLYSENKVQYQKLPSGAVTRTTRKKVVIDFKPTITDSGIVIKEGKK